METEEDSITVAPQPVRTIRLLATKPEKLSFAFSSKQDAEDAAHKQIAQESHSSEESERLIVKFPVRIPKGQDNSRREYRAQTFSPTFSSQQEAENAAHQQIAKGSNSREESERLIVRLPVQIPTTQDREKGDGKAERMIVKLSVRGPISKRAPIAITELSGERLGTWR